MPLLVSVRKRIPTIDFARDSHNLDTLSPAPFREPLAKCVAKVQGPGSATKHTTKAVMLRGA